MNGNAPEGKEADGTYSFIIKDSDGNPVGDKVQITVQDGKSEPFSVENLAPGEYKVTEETPAEKPGYEWKVEGDGAVVVKKNEETEVTFTNKYEPVPTPTPTEESTPTPTPTVTPTPTITPTPALTEVSGSKTWADDDNKEGKRPESIIIRLWKGTEQAGEATVTEADNWSWKFDKLPKYEDKQEITYVITEDEVKDYSQETNGYDVTNTYTPGKTSVSGSKTWEDADNKHGKRPESITIVLKKNGVEEKRLEVTEKDNWSWNFTDLPKNDKDGKEIEYTIEEANVPEGYTSEVNGYNVVNSYTAKTTEVSGSKTWDDANDQDGKRPESITIILKKNGEEVQRTDVTAEDGWSWSFTDLPRYDEDGKEIEYTIEEANVPEGYTSQVNGYDVVNSHTTETTEVNGSKTWNDNNDSKGMRPNEIVINLLKDGKVFDTKTVTEADNWSWSFTNLPKYSGNGVEAVYTIEEVPVDGYAYTVSGYDLINSTTTVSVRKTDIGNGTPLAGAHLQILDASGKVIADWVSTTGDFVVEGLNTETAYTLHEVTAPEGYEVAADTVFMLSKDGTIDTGNTTAAYENGVLLVEDQLNKKENTKITVVKTVSYDGLPLFVSDISFYVALYYDPECTKLAAPQQEIVFKDAISSEATFDNLEVGRTYYVGECDASGNMLYTGEVVGGTIYHAQFTGTNGNCVVTEEGDTTQVYLDNQMDEVPDGFYVAGELFVTKRLLGADGAPKNSDKKFYAGVFDDPQYTTPAECTEYTILELDMAGGSTAESSTVVNLPTVDSTVTLYVTEVNEDGDPIVGAPGFTYKVSVDNTEVSISRENLKAYVVITNQESEEEEGGGGGGGTTPPAKTPRTGDETPVLPVTAAAVISGLAAALLLYYKRRRRA